MQKQGNRIISEIVLNASEEDHLKQTLNSARDASLLIYYRNSRAASNDIEAHFVSDYSFGLMWN